jgi:signal transduction histidine kinase
MRNLRERAEAMGGSLEVQSVPRVGTTVRLHLAL